jgi:S1-C subfamily serine protease
MKLLLIRVCVALALALPGAACAQSRSSVEAPGRASLGFAYSSNLIDDASGALKWADYPVVRHVYGGSPAAQAGLRVGDQILRINGRDGTEPKAYHNPRIGERCTLVVQRGTQEVEISYVLTARTWPADEFTAPGQRTGGGKRR